ncbi:hypothetical protein [Marinagarivorans algicola]|uniref:hypothetical protein n=1 Tax=Marinagarivorans algicola TaxID=1513270 RepID=UPI00138ECAAF|nr:hypothetical protein [Marinagarivorans algicola]
MLHVQRSMSTRGLLNTRRFAVTLALFGLATSILPFQAYGHSSSALPAAAQTSAPEPEPESEPEPEPSQYRQYPEITRAIFLSYNDINDFIAQSPKATRVAPPELTDIAAHGPDVIKVIQGPDCNRDGQVDDRAQCIKAFYQLWLKFNR